MEYRARISAARPAEIKGKSLRDMAQAAQIPYPLDGDRWGDWEFDAKNLVLAYKSGRFPDYEVPLAEMNSSAAMLDWIFQIGGKSWADAKILGDLVMALDDLLRPQATLCSTGKDHELDAGTFVRRHIESGKRAKYYERN